MIARIKRKLRILKERLSGLDFTQIVNHEKLGFSQDSGVSYVASTDKDLRTTLEQLDINDTDAILDFGSGKGSAMVMMHKYGFGKVVGVEISEKLCAIARKNFQKLNLPKLEIYQDDARNFTNIDIYTYFYFYHPFSKPTMEVVMVNVFHSIRRAPRSVTLIYTNANAVYSRIIEKDDVFSMTHCFMGQRGEIRIYKNATA